MKCRCCDVLLTDIEATRRKYGTQEYVDMCNKCLFISDIPKIIPIVEREDFTTEECTNEEG